MPCTSDGYENAQSNEQKKELDSVTAMLCEVLAGLDDWYIKETFSPKVFQWWKQHKNIDKARKIREEKEKKQQLKELEAVKAKLQARINAIKKGK